MQPAPKRGALPTALWAIRSGLHPVAVKHWDKAPIGKGWGLTIPTRESLLRIYDENPGAGVGLALGPEPGLVDIEADTPEAAATLAELPATLGWSSARGFHKLYRWTPALAELGPSSVVYCGGLEIRKGFQGKQLMSVIPPTVGTNRRCRRWSGCWDVFPFPDTFLLRKEPTDRKPARVCVPLGNTHRYAAAALRGEAQAVAEAPEGTRNNRLNLAGYRLGGLIASGMIDRVTVEDVLGEAALDCGLGEREIRATLRSSIDAGMQHPR